MFDELREKITYAAVMLDSDYLKGVSCPSILGRHDLELARLSLRSALELLDGARKSLQRIEAIEAQIGVKL